MIEIATFHEKKEEVLTLIRKFLCVGKQKYSNENYMLGFVWSTLSTSPPSINLPPLTFPF